MFETYFQALTINTTDNSDKIFFGISSLFGNALTYIFRAFNYISNTDLDLKGQNITEEYSLVAASGVACILAATALWNISFPALFNKVAQTKFGQKFSVDLRTDREWINVPRNPLKPQEIKDTFFQRKLIDLIKTAYLPGHAEIAKNHISNQTIDVNEIVSPSGLTYFLCACLSGQGDLIAFMLTKGANINVKTVDGDSALYLATYAVLNSVDSDLEGLRVLIKAGCCVNGQNTGGYTPLHRAASKGNISVILFLLQQGADPYIMNNAGAYPIDSAICAGHLEAAELLKIKLPNPHVWDVVEPHTPPHIRLGLQSPHRKLLLESSKPKVLRKVLA